MMGREDDAAFAADSCSREPVHLTGHIQSHGLLFVLSEPALVVLQVSANVTRLLDTWPDLVLGHSLADVLGEWQFKSFSSYVDSLDDLLLANPLRLSIGPARLETNCIVHRQDGVLIAEFELLAGVQTLNPLNFVAHIEAPLARMESASDIVDLAMTAANEIRRLSGFERVMVYRFDERWNGEVIAENAGDSNVSYLGLRFPASDIPSQARRLFSSTGCERLPTSHRNQYRSYRRSLP